VNRALGGVLSATLACGASLAGAAEPPPGHLNFVVCPVVRDTTTVPCWLAEYAGETYFLTLQTDVSAPVTPPWLNHRVLVEGVRSDEPRICGGVVLKPVKLSVMPELDTSCNTVLPAEDRYNLGFAPPRPPGPSTGRLAFGNAIAVAPTATPKDAKRERREFVVTYAFDGLVAFRHPAELMPLLEYAQAIRAQRLEIHGRRGAVLLNGGQTMVERPDIGQRRAEQVAELLRNVGLTGPEFEVRWETEAAAADGVDDHEARRVVVTVIP
jgi:hypothetical protein